MARDPDEDGYGKKAVEAAQALVAATVAGDKDTVLAILNAMDRTDGPLVKERVQTNLGHQTVRVIGIDDVEDVSA